MSTREHNERDASNTHHHEQPGTYQIRVMGHLEARWSAWFDGLDLSREPDGTTTIQGTVADQAALYGLLQKTRDLGLQLLSITRLNPD